MLFSLGFIAMFTLGGLSGVLHSIVPADTQQTDTYFVVAHFHYVLFGGLGVRDLRRLLLLAAEGLRPDARRTAREVELLDDAHRVQPHVLPDALRRAVRHAAAHVPLRLRAGLGDLQPDRDDRRVHHRVLDPAVPRELHRVDQAQARARSRATTRGTRARSSGRRPRRRPSTTSRRSRRSSRATTCGTASTPRTTKAGSSRCRAAAPPRPPTRRGPRSTTSTCRRRRIYPFVDGARPAASSGTRPCTAVRVAAASAPRVLLFGMYAWAIEPPDAPTSTPRASSSPPGTRRPGTTAMATIEQTSEVGGPPAVPPTRARSRARRPRPASHNTKLAMWLFLASDCLFFGAFIAAYLLYRGRQPVGPDARGRVRHPVHVGDLVHPADEQPHDGARAGGDPARRPPPRAASGCSRPPCSARRSSPVRCSSSPSSHREGLDLDTNLFGTTFFVLTGFHGAHVTVGIIWLLSLWGLSMQGRLHQQHAEKVEIAGLYWHFVDVVWIVIFTVIYLVPQPGLAADDRRHRCRAHRGGEPRRSRTASSAARWSRRPACCPARSVRTRRRSST